MAFVLLHLVGSNQDDGQLRNQILNVMYTNPQKKRIIDKNVYIVTRDNAAIFVCIKSLNSLNSFFITFCI